MSNKPSTIDELIKSVSNMTEKSLQILKDLDSAFRSSDGRLTEFGGSHGNWLYYVNAVYLLEVAKERINKISRKDE